jgi:hypothetical protein
MKFILEDDRTKDRLQLWAQGKCLELPTFFFWKSGVQQQQRSQIGLLRSLLFYDLKDHDDLIPELLSEEWVEKLKLASHGILVTFDWTVSKLKSFLTRLVDLAEGGLGICFFIDGLDEYEGDYQEITEHFSPVYLRLQSLSSSAYRVDRAWRSRKLSDADPSSDCKI